MLKVEMNVLSQLYLERISKDHSPIIEITIGKFISSWNGKGIITIKICKTNLKHF